MVAAVMLSGCGAALPVLSEIGSQFPRAFSLYGRVYFFEVESVHDDAALQIRLWSAGGGTLVATARRNAEVDFVPPDVVIGPNKVTILEPEFTYMVNGQRVVADVQRMYYLIADGKLRGVMTP